MQNLLKINSQHNRSTTSLFTNTHTQMEKPKNIVYPVHWIDNLKRMLSMVEVRGAQQYEHLLQVRRSLAAVV